MTAQEIFDKVSNHLLTQNAQSLDNGSCVYRTEDGKHCAVGCLIPTEFYSERIEGMGVSAIEVMSVLHNSGVLYSSTKHTNEVMLLADLQEMHDKTDPSVWPMKLKDIAAAFNLTVNF
jgi:hypothetical protein